MRRLSYVLPAALLALLLFLWLTRARPDPVPSGAAPGAPSTRPRQGAGSGLDPGENPADPVQPAAAKGLLRLTVSAPASTDPVDFEGVLLTASGVVRFHSAPGGPSEPVRLEAPRGPAVLFVRSFGSEGGSLFQQVDVGAGESVLALTVQPGATLSGKLLSSDGAPAADVRVVAVFGAEGASALAREVLGGRSARLEAELSLVGGAGSSAVVQTAPVVVTADGARVEAWADAEGAFRFEGLPARPLRLELQRRRSAAPPQEAAVVPGSDPVTLTLAGR